MQWRIYKAGQGQNVRLWSALAFGAVAAAGAYQLYNKLNVVESFRENWLLHLTPPLVLAAIGGWFIYWICGSNPRSVDFMVATEGEMKKVSWSSRREVIGATKVVIGLMVVMSLYLFAVDFLVSSFFRLPWVGVLQQGTPDVGGGP
jgi:preprotein translocase subunit SecE